MKFSWGTAELISFRSADRVPLQAALYKPANFDPKKKYPLLVYIYERLSQNVHQFRIPNVTGGQVDWATRPLVGAPSSASYRFRDPAHRRKSICE